MKRGKALTQITDDATPIWHCLTTEECADKLTSDTSTGLSVEAAARQLQTGFNIIEERARRGLARMFFAQFNDFIFLVLTAAAVVSGVIGDLACMFHEGGRVANVFAKRINFPGRLRGVVALGRFVPIRFQEKCAVTAWAIAA